MIILLYNEKLYGKYIFLLLGPKSTLVNIYVGLLYVL